MLSTQGIVMVQVVFKVRQDYIIEHLCVNRDRPEVECNGYCQLSKMVAEAQENEDHKEEAALLEVLHAFHVLLPSRAALTPPAEQPRSAAPAGRSSDVFRPPRAA